MDISNEMQRVAALPCKPAVIARWLLIVFATVVLTVNLSNADAPDVVFLAVAFLPWFVGPAALAALLAMRAKSPTEAWFLVGVELVAVASTAWLWIVLFFVTPDAQNGIAMMLFPFVQFAAVLAFAFGVLVVARVSRRNETPSHADRSKGGLISIYVTGVFLSVSLSIMCFLFLYHPG